MDNIVSCKLDSRYASTLGIWQYDYGQVLRITGPELPPAVEVQFSLDEKLGETLSRVGTTVDGVTEVKIPDELLKHSATSNYRIYAYIYLTDETSGNTKYEITIPVRVRSKPTSPAEDPETDPDLFRETVVAVNASAERAENAASSAMESAASADETLAEIKRVADGISGNIENANTMKSELSDMINNAGIEKKELESSIGKAGEAKMALDSSIRSAGEKQLALDTTVEHANTVDASLKEHIGSAEQIQANVEQIANNKEDIGSLQEELGDIESKFEIETEAFSNKCSIIRNNTPNNFTGNQITGVKQYFDFGENAALTKIKMNIKASNDDTVALEIATLDGNIIATAEKAVTTEYTDVVFDLENIVIKEPVSVFVYTKGTNLLSYGLYATPYDDQSFSYIFPDGTRKSAFKIGTSEILKPTASNNKQCLVLFFDYTSKIIKNISDSISQNIDTTLLKSGKAADAKVVGDKLSKLKEDLSNKITKFYASNQGETHLADSDNGKIMDMMLYGRSEQKQYRGINLIPPNIKYGGFVEVSIPKGTKVFAITDGTSVMGGNFRFFNADKTENMWFGIDQGVTIATTILKIDAKYVQNLISPVFDLSKICLGIGNEPIYEPYVGGQPSPSPDYPQEIKRVVNPTVKVTNEDGLKVQSVTLNNITLNAISVSSGGNVTIDGKQYIADRVVEKDGVFGIERNIREIHTNTKTMNNSEEYPGWKKVEGISDVVYYNVDPVGDSRKLTFISNFTKDSFLQNNKGTNNILYFIKNIIGYSQSELIAKAIDVDMYIRLQDAIFEPLPGDIQAKLRTLVTNYPVTNISVTSDQLDGYTVFNYPISLADGWNYVKQQINDNRDYIYNMDARTQDTDLQVAEAYVNSEYAVALAELEV
jgi:hypothetical protein